MSLVPSAAASAAVIVTVSSVSFSYAFHRQLHLSFILQLVLWHY